MTIHTSLFIGHILKATHTHTQSDIDGDLMIPKSSNLASCTQRTANCWATLGRYQCHLLYWGICSIVSDVDFFFKKTHRKQTDMYSDTSSTLYEIFSLWHNISEYNSVTHLPHEPAFCTVPLWTISDNLSLSVLSTTRIINWGKRECYKNHFYWNLIFRDQYWTNVLYILQHRNKFMQGVRINQYTC